ncbi:MAG: hypothetical protein ABJE66_30365 [Deltaproteobacteria bacterium]
MQRDSGRPRLIVQGVRQIREHRRELGRGSYLWMPTCRGERQESIDERLSAVDGGDPTTCRPSRGRILFTHVVDQLQGKGCRRERAQHVVRDLPGELAQRRVLVRELGLSAVASFALGFPDADSTPELAKREPRRADREDDARCIEQDDNASRLGAHSLDLGPESLTLRRIEHDDALDGLVDQAELVMKARQPIRIHTRHDVRDLLVQRGEAILEMLGEHALVGKEGERQVRCELAIDVLSGRRDLLADRGLLGGRRGCISFEIQLEPPEAASSRREHLHTRHRVGDDAFGTLGDRARQELATDRRQHETGHHAGENPDQPPRPPHLC